MESNGNGNTSWNSSGSSSPVLGSNFRLYQQLKRRPKNAIFVGRDHVVQIFGPHMPFAVTEVLSSFTGDVREAASVNINSENGWAWFVSKRKLLIWRLSHANDLSHTSVCRELLLPSSDLYYSAGSVYVFQQSHNQTASCIAASPEGIIRYWNVIGSHCAWVDVNCHLGGEEVCALHYVPPVGFLAVTTSASLVLIKISKINHIEPVTVEHLTASQGWLNGLKRMSSVILGVMPSVHVPRIVKILTVPKENNTQHTFLLTGMKLQLRILGPGKNAEIVYDRDLRGLVRKIIFDELHGDWYGVTENDEENSDVVITDMQLSEGGLAVLVATVDPVNYFLVELPIDDLQPPSKAFKMSVLAQKDVAALQQASSDLSQVRFLLMPSSALVFNNSAMIAAPLDGGTKSEGDRISIPGDVVPGGNMYKNVPLFLSALYGFVTVSPIDTSCQSLLNSSHKMVAAELPKSISYLEADIFSSEDYISTIKTAFIMFIRKNSDHCKYLITKTFPQSHPQSINSPIAATIVKVSLDLINDVSNNDPRWGEAGFGNGISGITSVGIDTQLSEKLHAHEVFLKFVCEISEYMPLGKVTRQSTPVSTSLALLEHNEKIVAALSLLNLEKRFPRTIKEMIRYTNIKLDLKINSQLSPRDVFYRYVSVVNDGMIAFTTICNNLVKSGKFPEAAIRIEETNQIFCDIILEVHNKRNMSNNSYHQRYETWISSKNGLFGALYGQAKMSFQVLQHYSDCVSNYNKFSVEMLRLFDLILFMKQHSADTETYGRIRSSLVDCFIIQKNYRLAKELALKYRDYKNLILVHKKMEDDDMYSYMETFGKEFCSELFKWYGRSKDYHLILDLKVPPNCEQYLDDFLSWYPWIYWIHLVDKQDYIKASRVLARYAMDYAGNYCKKQKVLILAKLVTLVAQLYEALSPDQDEPFDLKQQIERLDGALYCIETQARLPEELLLSYYPETYFSSLSPSELIEILSSPDFKEATELDFLTALRLLPLIEDEESRHKTRFEVWSRAIFRDWTEVKTDQSIDDILKYHVFRLMSCIIALEPNPESIIPPVQQLLDDPGCENIASNPGFNYQLRLGYEAIFEEKN